MAPLVGGYAQQRRPLPCRHVRYSGCPAAVAFRLVPLGLIETDRGARVDSAGPFLCPARPAGRLFDQVDRSLSPFCCPLFNVP